MLYLDNPENGLAPETSHPLFAAAATDAFWYSSMDDFSPFGNDTGNDTLRLLEEWLTQHGAKANVADFIRGLIRKWDLDEAYLAIDDAETMKQLHYDEDQFLNDAQDQAVLAAALGQLKITGQLSAEGRQLAINAFQRQRAIAETAAADDTNPFRDAVPEYLERLAAMEAVFQKLT